jgi:hypothetical protein
VFLDAAYTGESLIVDLESIQMVATGPIVHKRHTSISQDSRRGREVRHTDEKRTGSSVQAFVYAVISTARKVPGAGTGQEAADAMTDTLMEISTYYNTRVPLIDRSTFAFRRDATAIDRK